MKYVFYSKVINGKGLIEAVHDEEDLIDSMKTLGIPLEDVPVFEVQPMKNTVLYVDLETKEITAEYTLIETEDVMVLEKRIKDAENKLRTPKERYDSLALMDTPIEELKKAKVEALKYQCTETTSSGFYSKSTGYEIGFSDADQRNMSNQLILFLADPSKTGCDWKMKSGDVHYLTKEQFVTLSVEGEEHTRSNIGKLWKLSTLVEGASSKAAVHNVKW